MTSKRCYILGERKHKNQQKTSYPHYLHGLACQFIRLDWFFHIVQNTTVTRPLACRTCKHLYVDLTSPEGTLKPTLSCVPRSTHGSQVFTRAAGLLPLIPPKAIAISLSFSLVHMMIKGEKRGLSPPLNLSSTPFPSPHARIG